MYYIDFFIANLNPEITIVGWILFLSSYNAFLSNYAANITTEVVPSPTYLSCNCES